MATVAEINASIPVATTSENSKSGSERLSGQQALGQDEFFKLLTTQLASQDPLNPMEDTAFIAQMAQFSSLEMQSTLNRNFEKFTSNQTFNAAQSMIGRNVSLLAGGEQVEGRAEAIESEDGLTRVFINGRGYDASGVYRIEEIPTPTATTSKQVESGGEE